MASPSSLVARNRRNRASTALSCQECRRLKLKCSRVFPCSNCVKKGCAAICPDGSLTTGKGNRFVLANTETLHDKINDLSNRVRQLEDGLAQSHALHSLQPHPLLSPDLLDIKRPLERERIDAPPKQDKSDGVVNDGVDAMGSLSISEGGRSTFFGQAANSWYLLQNETAPDDEDEPPDTEPAMPTDVPWIAYAFPFTANVSKTGRDVRATLLNLLPRTSMAQRFCEIYYRHAAWMYTPIGESDFYQTIFQPIYDPNSASYESVSSHNLAVLYMVLALGTLVDLDMPAHSPEATEYYQLGRAALAIDSVLEEPSIAGIQALLLMCHFMFWADIEGPRWVLMGLVVKLAHSIGLHRDSGRWNLDATETHRRRCLLYEIYTYDSWQSLTFGRPPSFSLTHIDAKLPHDSITNVAGEVEMSFAAWKHGWTSECLSTVHDQVFGARAPTYKTVRELDKKVRAYYVPPSLQVPGFGGSRTSTEVEQPTVELTMQRYCGFAIREMTLFYMHRGFFAHALEDNSQDPMGSKYAPSVLAAYTSACTFVGLIESLFKQHPALTERMWFYFMHVFSCAIVLGSIAVKPRMALAPSALSHLDAACSLFERVSDRPRTEKILPILHKLRARAHEALTNPDFLRPDSPTKVKTEPDELAALGGGTRLVTRRATSSTPSRSGSDPTSQPASPSPPIMVESPHAWQGFAHVQTDYNNFPQYTLGPGTAQSYDSPAMAQTIPEYYPYSPVGFPSPDDMNVPIPEDLTYSWQNFMSQFKG
ncbi:fungal-specific transcription factor domain-containing protein [Mycena alexandri]|uniref:Fungal-specific transcription factor domain-containing protein n=1 Tax=Mycena alexandri TaxID=1745969 RepID=A0AAD6T1N4_9AGAR|nr:fungal-specific transcription factor domain-containing protein [Mycena alexandri]